jgi:hypothetical protein
MTSKKIFVSHIAEERDVAHCLRKIIAASSAEVAVFVSSTEPPEVGHPEEAGPAPMSTRWSGVDVGAWMNHVQSELRSSQLIIALCGRVSKDAPWVMFEAGAAWGLGVPVLPVCHAGQRVGALGVPLTNFTAVDLDDVDAVKKLFELIGRCLGIDLKVPTHAVEVLRHVRFLHRSRDVRRRALRTVEYVVGPLVLPVVYAAARLALGWSLERASQAIVFLAIATSVVVGAWHVAIRRSFAPTKLVFPAILLTILQGISTTIACELITVDRVCRDYIIGEHLSSFVQVLFGAPLGYFVGAAVVELRRFLHEGRGSRNEWEI